MTSITAKDTTVSSRVSSKMAQNAKANLAKYGLSLSEYIRMAIYKAANDEVSYVNFLDTAEALQAKKEAETNNITKVGSLDDLDKWMDNL